VVEALAAAEWPCRLETLQRDALPRGLSAERSLILPLVHGAYGEGVVLSVELEMGGFAYGGSRMAASVLAFDKYACKGVAAASGLQVAAGSLLRAGTGAWDFANLASRFGLPFIVKPRADGSSCGLAIVDSAEAWERGPAQQTDGEWLVEAHVGGMDLTVAVLQGRALGVIGVEPVDGGCYDYAHKYTVGMTHYHVPAELPEALSASIRADAERIFADCGCRDIARVDFRGHAAVQRATFLEVNTLPGMTATSLLPKSAGVCGISFIEVLERWIGMAAARHPRPSGEGLGGNER
jgi:D-alanine-D-alanine ligase